MNSSHVGFIKCLTLLALSLSGVDVTPFKAKFNRWLTDADPFLRKHSLLRAFKKEVNVFLANNMEFTEEDGVILNKVLKPFLPDFVKDTAITQEQLALLKDCSLFFKQDSAPAWKRINNNVSILGDIELAGEFSGDTDSTTTNSLGDMSISQGMAKIVKKLTLRINDPILTLNEMRDFRATNAKDMEQYSALRKQFVANYKLAIMKLIRSSGKALVNVNVASKYLAAQGCNMIPKGFVGQIDEKGALYTSAGKKIMGMLIGEVVMNPKYDPKTDNTYVCSLKANGAQRLRTETFLAANKTDRFNKVHEFIKTVDGHRDNWLKDLRSLDQKTATIAAMIETIYLTQARVGGKDNEANGEKTYGITTVTVAHTKFPTDGSVSFSYPGKKGTMQHHILKPTTVSNRKVISIIKNLAKNKTKVDTLFTYAGHAISSSALNAYLKSKGINVTAHKFRHLQGTKMAMDILAKSPFKKTNPPSQAAAEKWLKEAAKDIGTALHHRTGTGDNQKVTSATALQSYVDPSIVKTFFTDLGLRIPKWVPKTLD